MLAELNSVFRHCCILLILSWTDNKQCAHQQLIYDHILSNRVQALESNFLIYILVLPVIGSMTLQILNLSFLICIMGMMIF